MSGKSNHPPVRLVNLQSRLRLSEMKIRHLMVCALEILHQDVELHLTLTNDRQIRKLNREFHGTDRATDVLAFQAPVSRPFQNRRPFLGEVIVSVERAEKDAKRFGATPDEELVRYMIHGILHLLGERDHTKLRKARMFLKQEKVLNQLKPIPRLLWRS